MLGRATLRTLTALDQGPRPQHGPESYVQAVSQVLPGWVLSLLAGSLLLPVLVASVDAFARARGAGRWTCCAGCAGSAAWVAPFLAALALAAVPGAGGRNAGAASGARAARTCSRWTVPRLPCWRECSRRWCSRTSSRRWLAVRPDSELREPVEPGAGVALALAIAAGSLLLWLVNPYAGLLAVPAAHLWMLTVAHASCASAPPAGGPDRARSGAGGAGGDLLPVRPARWIRCTVPGICSCS